MEVRLHIFLIFVLRRRGWSRPHPGSFMSMERPSIPVEWASGTVETCCRNENRSPVSRTQARVSAALPTELYQLLYGYATQLQVTCSRSAYCHGSFVHVQRERERERERDTCVSCSGLLRVTNFATGQAPYMISTTCERPFSKLSKVAEP
jgi:hypothetical protein